MTSKSARPTQWGTCSLYIFKGWSINYSYIVHITINICLVCHTFSGEKKNDNITIEQQPQQAPAFVIQRDSDTLEYGGSDYVRVYPGNNNESQWSSGSSSDEDDGLFFFILNFNLNIYFPIVVALDVT